MQKYRDYGANPLDNEINILHYYLHNSFDPNPLVVQNLIQIGVDIHYRDNLGHDALLRAAYYDKTTPEVFEILF